MALHPDITLGIHLSAICSRNCYTQDPDPIIDELLHTAGDRVDILAMEAGRWSGFWERDQYRQPLIRAIRARIPGAIEWVQLGRDRDSSLAHGAGGIHAPKTTKAVNWHPYTQMKTAAWVAR